MEEISLKELLGTLYRHKLLIIGIIVITLMFSIIYAFFVAAPVYQMKSEITVTGINTDADELDRYLEPSAIIDTCIGWLQKPEFLDKVSRQLASRNLKIDVNTLKGIVSASKSSDGSSMYISAEYTNKAEVAPVFNALIEVLNEEVSVYINEKIKKQMDITLIQVKLKKEYLEKALLDYKKYVSEEESLPRLKSQMDIDLSVLKLLRSDLLSGNIGQGSSSLQLEKEINIIQEKINETQLKVIEAKYKGIEIKSKLKYAEDSYDSINELYYSLEQDMEYFKDKSNTIIRSNADDQVSASVPNKKFIIVAAFAVAASIALVLVFTIEYLKNKR